MSNDRMASSTRCHRNLVSSQRNPATATEPTRQNVTPELSDRPAWRRLNELVNRAGGGEKRGRSRIIELLREVAVLYGCPSPSSDDSELQADDGLSRLGALRKIEELLYGGSVYRLPKDHQLDVCRLTSVVRDQRREKDDEWSRRNEPLHRVRADGFAALIAHVVSCAIALGPPLPFPPDWRQDLEDVEGQFGAAPHRMEIAALARPGGASPRAQALASPRVPNTAASSWLSKRARRGQQPRTARAWRVPPHWPTPTSQPNGTSGRRCCCALRVAAVGDASGGAEGGGLASAPLLTGLPSHSRWRWMST